MSTANFHSVNATKIFAVDLGDMDDYMIEDGLVYVADSLCDASSEWDSLVDVSNVEDSSQALRSYPRRYLAKRDISFTYAGIEIDLTIRTFACSGYYSGYCLDWELLVYGWNGVESVGDSHRDDYTLIDYIDNQIEMATQDGYTNSGLVALNRARLIDKVQGMIDTIVAEVEVIYTNVSQPLVMVGQFSNGEAVYQTA